MSNDLDLAEEMGNDDLWHLSNNEEEAALTDFEFVLEAISQAYYRWKSECLTTVSGTAFTGQDAAVLNVIRMKERPKSLSDIARLLNREDMSNVQYTLRKLLRIGLIEKLNASSKKGTIYRVTDRGRELTGSYAKLRSEVLLKLVRAVGKSQTSLSTTGHFLDLMTGIYDQAARAAATRRA